MGHDGDAASGWFSIVEDKTMRVVNSIKTAKSRNKNCKVVRRRGVTFVICKTNPKFKARQGKPSKKRYF